MKFSSMIQTAVQNPEKLILVDGLGALLSAFSLGILLPAFQPYFGMPVSVLYVLAIFPVFFALYDFTCYARKPQNWALFIRIIAVANLLYCCLSISLLLYHFTQLTSLGGIYFILELIIVITLAIFELQVANLYSRQGIPLSNKKTLP